MAKGSISKGKKAPSIHSRAARRATSPSIDTDKSLKNVQPPPKSLNQRPAVLAAHHTGGVTKKKSGRKAVLSSKARRRQLKSIDRAEAVMDRTAVKVQKSISQAKTINARKKAWDEINREAYERTERLKMSRKALAKLEEDAMVEEFYADADGNVEMDGTEGMCEASGAEAGAGAGAAAVGAAGAEGSAATGRGLAGSAHAHAAEEDEEIL
ncbi:hypothetical protein VTJ04DRAFT_6086 [Mycothermus thermophilus]|uniref:uncharacterized protein n=1 Tax=Humicola insolens TaxID=85995 RepID=UPI0037432845